MFFFQKNKIFKELQFLGYDPILIKEVLKTHKTFESALEALRAQTCNTLKSELSNYGIPEKSIEILLSRFQSLDDAVKYYNNYQKSHDSIKKSLSEMGFSPYQIDQCLLNLWSLEECFENFNSISQPEEVKNNNELVILENENSQSIRFSIRNTATDSGQVFEINRSEAQGDFENLYESLTISRRRDSLRRRGFDLPVMPGLPEPLPLNSPVPLSEPASVESGGGPSQVLLLNLAILEAALNNDHISVLILMRILAELVPQPHLNDSELEELESFEYNKSLQLVNNTCTICYEDFTEGNLIIKLKCCHCFDSECIKTWLKNSIVCPLCKCELKPSS